MISKVVRISPSRLNCNSSIPAAFEVFNSSEALEQAYSNLQAVINNTHTVITNDDLPVIWGDISQIVQLFQNLLSNSIKFHDQDAPRIHVSAERTGKEWVFSVRDNGIGIKNEYLDRIFTMFQRLHSKSEYNGTGIGLTICKKIVEGHKGKIWVESELGKGTTFYFTVPYISNQDQKNTENVK